MALGADDGAGCSVEILSLLLELVLIREVNLTGELGSLVSGNMAEYDGLDEGVDPRRFAPWIPTEAHSPAA